MNAKIGLTPNEQKAERKKKMFGKFILFLPIFYFLFGIFFLSFTNLLLFVWKILFFFLLLSSVFPLFFFFSVNYFTISSHDPMFSSSLKPRGLRLSCHQTRKYSRESLRKVEKFGKVSKQRMVPSSIARPAYALGKGGTYGDMPVIPLLKGEEEEKMRRACKLARKVLDFASSLIRPGISTELIDEAVHNMIIQHGAYPSTLGYHGFPKSCCTSVNNVMAHGIPDSLPLFNGDIINVDITVYLEGYHGDCSETYLVGEGHGEEEKRLVRVAKEARDSAIALCAPGLPLNIIGHSISDTCERNGYFVPEGLTGHGIGEEFHAWPYILHSRNDLPHLMTPGMTFTIEPLVCQSTDQFFLAPDQWTLLSQDGSWSAQFEHTILITNSGHEILTL